MTTLRKLYLFKFLMSLHFFGGVMIPFFIDWGGVTFFQVMILQSFFMVVIVSMEVPTGAVADYWGRRASLLLSVISIILGVFFYSTYPDFRLFLAGEFFWGTGYALLSGADEAMIYDALKENRSEGTSKKVFGRYGACEMAGYLVSAPVGSLIAQFIGLRFSMMFMAIPFFFALILMLTVKEPEYREHDTGTGYWETIVSGLKYFRKHKVLKILAFDRISVHVISFCLIWIYQPILKKIGVPIIYFGFIHALLTGVQVVIMNSFSFFENILGSKKRYLLVGAIIPAASYMLLYYASHVAAAVLLMALITGFGMSRQFLFQSYMNKYIESENRSTVISSISMIERGVMALAYPLLGLLVEYSLRTSCLVLGSLLLACALAARTSEENLLD